MQARIRGPVRGAKSADEGVRGKLEQPDARASPVRPTPVSQQSFTVAEALLHSLASRAVIRSQVRTRLQQKSQVTCRMMVQSSLRSKGLLVRGRVASFRRSPASGSALPLPCCCCWGDRLLLRSRATATAAQDESNRSCSQEAAGQEDHSDSGSQATDVSAGDTALQAVGVLAVDAVTLLTSVADPVAAGLACHTCSRVIDPPDPRRSGRQGACVSDQSCQEQQADGRAWHDRRWTHALSEGGRKEDKEYCTRARDRLVNG